MTTMHAPPEPGVEAPFGRRTTGDRSLASLVMQLRDEAADLIKNEIRLARAELTDKAQDVKKGVISSATGGAVVYAGALMLLLAAAAGLYAIMVDMEMSPYIAGWLAPLIVGAITLAVGLGMLLAGKNKMSGEHLRPERTQRSLEETRDWAERAAGRTAEHFKPGASHHGAHQGY